MSEGRLLPPARTAFFWTSPRLGPEQPGLFFREQANLCWPSYLQVWRYLRKLPAPPHPVDPHRFRRASSERPIGDRMNKTQKRPALESAVGAFIRYAALDKIPLEYLYPGYDLKDLTSSPSAPSAPPAQSQCYGQCCANPLPRAQLLA